MKSAKEKFDICETIIRILDGSIDPAAFQAFERNLVEDAELRRLYLSVLETYSHMQKPGSSFGISAIDDDEEQSQQGLWQTLARMEKEAPAVEIEQVREQPERVRKVAYAKRAHRFKKSTLIPIVMTAAAVLMVLLFVRFAPVRDTYYGQIVDSYEAVFAGSATHLQQNGYLCDEMIKLQNGFVRIQMDDGSQVLLEAPAELRLEANDQVFLLQGKLTADVPKSGIGFTVRTPSASIVDYGTEFGVSIDQYAKTEAHVLKGNVEMRLGSNQRVFEKALRLSANQAASVSGQTLSRIPVNVKQFTYRIPTPFEGTAQKLEPVMYFRLKENDIDTFCDTTGKNAIAIHIDPGVEVVPGPSLGNARSGYAVRLNGRTPLQVQDVLPVFADQNGDYTVACWVRIDQVQKQVIWSNRVANSDNQGYERVLWVNDQGRLEHTAYFPDAEASSQKVNTLTGPEVLKPNQWYLVTISHAQGGYKMLYINGRQVAKSSVLQATPLEKYNDLAFGQPVAGLGPGLTGAVADILFFSRSLSGIENQQLYQSTLQE